MKPLRLQRKHIYSWEDGAVLWMIRISTVLDFQMGTTVGVEKPLSQSRKHMEQICRLARPYSATSQREKHMHTRTLMSWLQGFHPLHLIFQLLAILKSTRAISTLPVSTYIHEILSLCRKKSLAVTQIRKTLMPLLLLMIMMKKPYVVEEHRPYFLYNFILRFLLTLK